MQTVSKTYGAADAEAPGPAAALEKKPGLGRVTVATICLAAALSGAAVASVARVRTRAYVADLAGVSYTMGASELCGDLGKCEEPTECYKKLKDNGETKYKCAEGSPGNKWTIVESARSKKKPGPDSLSGGGGKPSNIVCTTQFDPVCDTEGKWHSNACVAKHQMRKTISHEHVFDNGKCLKR